MSFSARSSKAAASGSFTGGKRLDCPWAGLMDSIKPNALLAAFTERPKLTSRTVLNILNVFPHEMSAKAPSPVVDRMTNNESFALQNHLCAKHRKHSLFFMQLF